MLNSNNLKTAHKLNPSLVQNSSYTPNTKSIIFIISFASFVAFFDFTIFLYSTDTITKAFFPTQDDSLLKRLQVITLFATGFAARPLGAWLIGRFGDKKGRKQALNLSMFIFLACAAVGSVLPTFDQIGYIAPILLILVRLTQGAAFGAQIILAWIYLAESVPRDKLAYAISICLASIFIGSIVCSSLYEFIANHLYHVDMNRYGWRLMFTASFIMSLIAYLLVRRLDETPSFKHFQSLLIQREKQSKPTTKSFSLNELNVIIIIAFLSLIGTSLALMISVILPQLLIIRYSIDESLMYGSNIFGMVGLIIGILFYGNLADRIGAPKALMIGSVFLAFVVIGFYFYCLYSDMSLIVAFYGLLGFASGIDMLCIFIIIHLFPIETRLTSTGVIYNLVTVFTGAVLPFVLIYTTPTSSYAPFLYLILISICAFFIAYQTSQSSNLNKLKYMHDNS